MRDWYVHQWVLVVATGLAVAWVAITPLSLLSAAIGILAFVGASVVLDAVLHRIVQRLRRRELQVMIRRESVDRAALLRALNRRSEVTRRYSGVAREHNSREERH